MTPTTIKKTHTYPHAAAELFKVFVTEALIPQRYEGVGARGISVKQHQQDGNTVTIKTVREIRADVPGALAKFAKEWNQVEQQETWVDKGNNTYECEFKVSIAGVPIDMSGHMTIETDGEGCSNSIELNLHCGLPFIGKMLEKFVSVDSERSMAQEFEWITTYLKEHS